MTSSIDTRRSADRRRLHFDTVREVRLDMDRLLEGARHGRLRAAGNWSAGRIFGHLARWIEMSYDGFPFVAPWPLRIAGRLLKRRALRSAMRPGLTLPRGMLARIGPYPDYTVEAGAALLRAQLDRIERAEPMTRPSPLFGPMTHADWIALHLRHAELHLSFLHLEPPAHANSSATSAQ